MDEASESRRLLIATGAVAADAAQLPALVRELIESASDILVISPILPGRLQWLVSDTDRARYEADDRLESVSRRGRGGRPGGESRGSGW